MNPDNDSLTEKIIGCAIQVHRELGPGFLESVYEEAMAIAMEEAGLRFQRQLTILIQFHGRQAGQHRLDFLVEDEVVLELKAISALENVHLAIVRSYLKASLKRCGVLLNFAAAVLQIKRVEPSFVPKVTTASSL